VHGKGQRELQITLRDCKLPTPLASSRTSSGCTCGRPGACWNTAVQNLGHCVPKTFLDAVPQGSQRPPAARQGRRVLGQSCRCLTGDPDLGRVRLERAGATTRSICPGRTWKEAGCCPTTCLVACLAGVRDHACPGDRGGRRPALDSAHGDGKRVSRSCTVL
jgi:hypothetical protein